MLADAFSRLHRHVAMRHGFVTFIAKPVMIMQSAFTKAIFVIAAAAKGSVLPLVEYHIGARLSQAVV